jgi:hypothetical protein
MLIDEANSLVVVVAQAKNVYKALRNVFAGHPWVISKFCDCPKHDAQKCFDEVLRILNRQIC